MDFQLVTSYKPRRDQPRAIDELLSGLAADGTWGARLFDSHA
jgi:excinuclease UvrABC helicase subunit UvrB